MTTKSNNSDEEEQGQEGQQHCKCTECRTTISSNAESGPVHSYFVRWNGLCKRVNVKADSGGLLKKSIAAEDVKKRHSTLKSNSNKKKTILNQVSGWAAPGKVLALIGPSGSGKTSLLNALSGRTSIDEGTISVNGKPLTHSTSHHASDSHSSMKRFMSQVAYVRQEDIFFTHLTTRDQLAYTAFLKLPPTWTRAEKLAKVDETIHALRLSKVQNSPIKLLSGGEQKRVNIGTELLTNPSCLLLDEPTSGLDSTSAVALVKLLQRLAQNEQKTVIMSIHQPSSGMFLSFDNLLLLADGHVVYHGTPRGSIQYLKDRGLACPEGYNIADHWMDLLVSGSSLEDDDNEDCTTLTRSLSSDKIVGSLPMADGEQGSSELMPSQARTARPTTKQQLIEIWDAAIMSEVMESEDFATEGSPDLSLPVKKYSTSWGTQYCVLVHRALKNSRSAIFTPLNMIKSLLLGIMSGMMWFQLDYTEETVRDRSAYFFFSMTYWVFDSMYGAVLAFPSERRVILKERASASYHLSAYFMAKTTSEAPTRLTMPLLYVTISFWMGGMSSTFSLFVYTTLISLLSVLAGESYGLLIGASVDEMDRALTTTTLVSLLMMIVGGFYVENVPSFLGWIKYISPFKYSFDACRSIVFNEPVPCDGSGELQDLCNNGQEFVSPEDLKTFLEINGTLAFNVGMLIVLGLVPRLFAYFVLKFRKSSVR